MVKQISKHKRILLEYKPFIIALAKCVMHALQKTFTYEHSMVDSETLLRHRTTDAVMYVTLRALIRDIY